MKKVLSVLLIVISVIFLLVSIFFAIGFSIDTGDMINPASAVMPIILAVVSGVGAVILLIASVKWRKEQPAKKYFIIAICIFILALVLIPITKAINQQMIMNMYMQLN